MEKENNSQLELFSQAKNYNQSQPSANPFFTYAWRHEKAIIMVITGLFIGIISFSLGVEKGKRLALAGTGNRMTVKNQVIVEPTSPKTKPAAASEIKEKQETARNPALDYLENNYTIQLASYQARGAAQKEAEALKKKGMSPLVLSKGKYTVVCVGKFANREKAKVMLSELKKRYKDCLLRRL